LSGLKILGSAGSGIVVGAHRPWPRLWLIGR